MNKRNTFITLLKMSLAAFVLVLLCSGCGQGAKKTEETPAATPKDQLNESDLSPKESPAPSVVEIKKQIVSLYFSDNDLNKIHRIEREINEVDKEALPKAALEEWLKGPGSEYTNLVGIVPPGVIIEYVKDVNGVANVSFSKEIKSANLGSSGEAALLEQLAMVLQQFGFAETQILLEGKIEESLLGHMETNVPMKANDPKDYEFVEKG